MRLARDASLSAIAAGFVTVLVGFTSSGVLVFQAARASGASAEGVGSWILALGVGMALTCIGLSLRYRAPVVTAWSTPGAAVLVTAVVGFTPGEVVGAFVASAALMTAAGFSGWFERFMSRIPGSIASAMLAGILLRFGLDVFASMRTQLGLVLLMFLVYLAARRRLPRYAVVTALAAGIVASAALGLLRLGDVDLALARPVFTAPRLSARAIVGVALPLFVVTMASQNIPGLAVLRASGFDTPASPLVGWTGAATLLLAPFGGYALNLAAITAAICTGREAHEDPSRRYVASVAAGAFYLVVGIFGATVGSAFAAFPKEMVLAIAGLALFGTIGSGLAGALRDEREREPALITFLVSASGLALWGIGSAFWGLVAGVLALLVLRR